MHRGVAHDAQQIIENADRYLGGSGSSTVSGAVHAAKEVLSSVESAIGATANALKTEVDEISKTGGKVVETTRAEVIKHPLLYTLAAAGAGLFLGAALVAVFGYSRR